MLIVTFLLAACNDASTTPASGSMDGGAGGTAVAGHEAGGTTGAGASGRSGSAGAGGGANTAGSGGATDSGGPGASGGGGADAAGSGGAGASGSGGTNAAGSGGAGASGSGGTDAAGSGGTDAAGNGGAGASGSGGAGASGSGGTDAAGNGSAGASGSDGAAGTGGANAPACSTVQNDFSWEMSDDSGASWSAVTLPYTDFGCSNCTRLFRTSFEGKPCGVSFRFGSDNEARMFVKETAVFEDYYVSGNCSTASCCAECCDSTVNCNNVVNSQVPFTLGSSGLEAFSAGKNEIRWQVNQQEGGSGFYSLMTITY
jgi:hypothetical protein